MALFWPDGMTFAGAGTASDEVEVTVEPATSPPVKTRPAARHPEVMDEGTAVRIAHDNDIDLAASYLDSRLSVLVRCEKLLVEHLAVEIAGRAGGEVHVVEPREPKVAAMGQGGRRQDVLAALQSAVRNAKDLDIIVVSHLDLLAGGSDAALGQEARELTDVLYERSKVVLLAFVDPSLVIPEVLANRFAVRIAIDILPRDVVAVDGTRMPIGQALVTRTEAALFEGFDPVRLYKHIAGLNAVRLRHAMIFAANRHANGATFTALLAELRVFKASTTSGSFDVPNVLFSSIGGYPEVHAELNRALTLIRGSERIPESLRSELLPSGFIFHGPPGTGKTLFAKAVATSFEATILVVSGPEVTDMYVGESERKVREIFAEARRNSPAVIVFDEFDSIAARRSGREDGGARAGNAIVAQLLTEMDGFRPELPVIIIGTTNRLDMIDEALLRPSRFRPIQIGLPDPEARRAIAKVHAKYFGIDVSDALLDRIAQATRLMNGDEIRSVFRDALANNLLAELDEPVTSRQLGELVGQLRRATQQRDAARASGAATVRATAIGQPAIGMTNDAMVTLFARTEQPGSTEPATAQSQEPPA
jgi:transitional endoplasmic reticulum ATPase